MTSLLLGILGGGRTFLVVALVAWLARFAALPINHHVAWLASAVALALLTLLALAELIYDKSPRAESRKRPPALAARMAFSALVAFALTPAQPWLAIALGGGGALLGTFALHEFRARLSKALGRDLPAALLEDALIVAAALTILRW